MCNIGKQWTIGEYISIDYYFGMGVGAATKDNTENKGIDYAIVGPAPVYLQTGLKLGVMF